MYGVPSASVLSAVGFSPLRRAIAKSDAAFAISVYGFQTVAVCLPRRTFWRPAGEASCPETGTFKPALSRIVMTFAALLSFGARTASTFPPTAVRACSNNVPAFAPSHVPAISNIGLTPAGTRTESAPS